MCSGVRRSLVYSSQTCRPRKLRPFPPQLRPNIDFFFFCSDFLCGPIGTRKTEVQIEENQHLGEEEYMSFFFERKRKEEMGKGLSSRNGRDRRMIHCGTNGDRGKETDKQVPRWHCAQKRIQTRGSCVVMFCPSFIRYQKMEVCQAVQLVKSGRRGIPKTPRDIMR